MKAKTGENRPLRKQMSRVMLVVAITPLALLALGGSAVVWQLTAQARQDSQAIYDELVWVVGEGFMQAEGFQIELALRFGAEQFAARGTAEAGEILESFFELCSNAMIYGDRPSDYLFVARQSEILAVLGPNDVSPSDFFQYMSDIVNPTLPFLFLETEGLTLSQMISNGEDWGMLYSQNIDTPSHREPYYGPAYICQWINIPGGLQLGIFRDSARGEMMVDILRSLVAMKQEQSAKNTQSILLYAGIALAMIFFALFGAIFCFSRKLSRSVSAPVERRERERDELLHRAEEEKAILESLNQMKTEFLSNVSHELKTPLTVISSQLQAGQQKLTEIPDTEDLERRMRLVSGEAERMALMVGQLLDVGRIDEGRMTIEPRPEAIVEIIQNSLNTYYPLFQKNGNELRFLPEENLPHVLCDRVRVTQVLVNLISNASRHTIDGEITVSAGARDGHAAISVKDTGEGIPGEHLPHLFDRYHTRRNIDQQTVSDTGTGLGLYICRQIVEAHGGVIMINSEPGEGAEVTFTLPFA